MPNSGVGRLHPLDRAAPKGPALRATRIRAAPTSTAVRTRPAAGRCRRQARRDLPVWTTVDQTGKVKIDMAPIRREMFRQILPEGRIENLTPEERQRVAAEINQRMLGIEQGIKLSAAELARQAQQAEKAAEKAAAAQKTGAKTSEDGRRACRSQAATPP